MCTSYKHAQAGVPVPQKISCAAGGGCGPQYSLIDEVVCRRRSETQQCCVSTSRFFLDPRKIGVIRVICGEVFDAARNTRSLQTTRARSAHSRAKAARERETDYARSLDCCRDDEVEGGSTRAEALFDQRTLRGPKGPLFHQKN
jgi:hypothetical protein